VILENKFTDEPLTTIRYNFLAISGLHWSRVTRLLIDQFTEWYLQRGWDAPLKKARSLVQFIKDTNPTKAQQAVQSVIEVANVLFEPYLTFQVEHWEAKQLDSVVDRHVVIRAPPRSVK
jgi:hypothetical protein